VISDPPIPNTKAGPEVKFLQNTQWR